MTFWQEYFVDECEFFHYGHALCACLFMMVVGVGDCVLFHSYDMLFHGKIIVSLFPFS